MGRRGLEVLHAPVFYGATFSVFAEVDAFDKKSIADVCREAEFVIAAEGDPGPSNVSAAGEQSIVSSQPEHDPPDLGSFWLWGPGGNILAPPWNAGTLAEKSVSGA